MRKGKRVLINKTYKRFIGSFLIVLALPIICFIFLFMQNFREIYRKQIIAQASGSLEMAGKELGRNIEKLRSVAYYNYMNDKMSKNAVLKDYHGTTVRSVLSAELATNSILEKIAYYTKSVPNMVYTQDGTYTVSYYAMLCTDLDNGEQFLARLEEISDEWILCKLTQDGEGQEEAVQYVLRSGTKTWWIFNISGDALGQILGEKDAVTILQNDAGVQLYATGTPDIESSYKITYDHPDGKFQLVRYIDKEKLFADLNMWQGYFFVAVIAVLLVGGVLVFGLTLYNGHPIREIVSYGREKLQNIPTDMDALETFQFVTNAMEEQINREEKKNRINRLLLHLIYDKGNDPEFFQKAMKEEQLFEHAEYFRVIMIVTAGEYETGLANIDVYLNCLPDQEYEIHLIDIPQKSIMVMIVGMTEDAEADLRKKLMQIADLFEEETEEEIYFYAGDKCKELRQIHTSYSQALVCSQKNEGNSERVCYYKSLKNSDKAQDSRTGSKETRDDNEEMIGKVLGFIEENSRASELNVNMVAEHFKISVSLLSQKFKKQVNSNISDYITEKKFAYACELLKETDYSVKEITFMTGYSHPVSFIRKFKQLYGMTPIEYRTKEGKV